MKLFFKTLWRNAKKIILGGLGIAFTFAAIWFLSVVLITVCNALKLATEWLGALAWEYKWIAVLLLAIFGGTIAELFIIFSRRKKVEERNRRTNREH